MEVRPLDIPISNSKIQQKLFVLVTPHLNLVLIGLFVFVVVLKTLPELV